VDELQLAGLGGQGIGDFADAMPNEVHHGGTGEVEIAIAVVVPQVHAFAANRAWENSVEGAVQQSGTRFGGDLGDHASDYGTGRVEVSKGQTQRSSQPRIPRMDADDYMTCSGMSVTSVVRRRAEVSF